MMRRALRATILALAAILTAAILKAAGPQTLPQERRTVSRSDRGGLGFAGATPWPV